MKEHGSTVEGLARMRIECVDAVCECADEDFKCVNAGLHVCR